MSQAQSRTTVPYQWFTHSLVRSVAVTTPAVRIVVVVVDAWRDIDGVIQSHHDVYPVVAVRCSNVAVYSRREFADVTIRRPGSHREAVAAGWIFDPIQSGTEESMIVLDLECGKLLASTVILGIGDDHVVVSCPWAPSEDEGRLRPFVEQIAAQIVEREREARLPRESPGLAGDAPLPGAATGSSAALIERDGARDEVRRLTAERDAYRAALVRELNMRTPNLADGDVEGLLREIVESGAGRPTGDATTEGATP